MLTIQSNLKIQDLETLSKILIKPDIINFGLNKVGGGYTDKIADKVIAKLSKLDKNKIIVIINDITLQMADKLLEAGYKNIYLAFGRFNKDGSVSKDKTVYNIMKAIIKNNIKQKLNVISLEEIFSMKIDGVIANPPYKKIGCNITDTIREKVDYEEFINLLPANDYKRGKDSFKYVREMECITKTGSTNIDSKFEDAAVTTHVAKIVKSPRNITEADFDLEQYLDRKLDRYFTENRKRQHYAIDNAQLQFVFSESPLEILQRAVLEKTFVLHCREINHKHLSGKTSETYLWNTNQVDAKDFVLSHQAGSQQHITFGGPIFNTTVEKENVAAFSYSKNGSRFLAKLWTCMNVDSSVLFSIWFPKVDWTRSWTVEEILRDYGYTEEEIAEVMADLDNFKGMDD